MTIETNIENIRRIIIDAKNRFGRKSHIKLIAVSKTRSIEEIQQVIATGIACFGENYLQEALPKIKAISSPNLEWHFIGPIQSNKTRAIAENFAWVDSLCNVRIAKRLNDQRPLELPRLNVCIQVNIQSETSKSGISIDEVSQVASAVVKLPRLCLRGLMAIPAPETDFMKQRQAFKQLYHAFVQLKQQGFDMDTLSMGMSGDYIAAIAEGATVLRLGTVIFGPRKYQGQ